MLANKGLADELQTMPSEKEKEERELIASFTVL